MNIPVERRQRTPQPPKGTEGWYFVRLMYNGISQGPTHQNDPKPAFCKFYKSGRITVNIYYPRSYAATEIGPGKHEFEWYGLVPKIEPIP
jgi:hypothetical protein